ncbi:MAG: hypothetical protein H0X51_06470 [Parachlamydiaceae bacterium]|nr:hypothetical protein [Parachlamydiaceae bacterium]
MTIVQKMCDAAPFALVGGAIGYGSALLLPTVTPAAGFIICGSFGAAIKVTSFFDNPNADSAKNDKDIMRKMAFAAIYAASLAFSYLACVVLHIPISLAAIFIFVPINVPTVILPVAVVFWTASKAVECARGLRETIV